MGTSKRTRRRFSSEDKAAAVKRHALGGEAVSVICEELGVAAHSGEFDHPVRRKVITGSDSKRSRIPGQSDRLALSERSDAGDSIVV